MYLTELVMVLNHKIWRYYQNNDELARLYNDLWVKASDYALDNLTDAELDYYLEVTD